jgi:MSHA biogenesis protein MshK
MAKNLRQLIGARQFRQLSGAVIAAVCAAMISVHIARAQTLVDPTLPPDMPAMTPGVPVARSLMANVQTIKISPNGPVALVNGRLVRVGDSIGEARVERITETEVVLHAAGSAPEIFKLHPRVDKRPLAAPATRPIGNAPPEMLSAGK